MDSLDEFQRSALAYKELVDNHVRYRIEFFSDKPVTVALGSEKTAETIRLAGNTINTLEVIFTPDEFKHLSSVHKLKDIDDLSKPLYDKAVNISGHGKKFDMNNIRRSNYFFDDIDKSQNPETKDMADEEFQEMIEEKTDKYFLSKLLGRLDSLEHLYDTLAQSGLTEIADSARPLELKMYVWDRQASHCDRPHGSKIQANFLIEIENPDNPDKPYTDFFIVRAKDGTYRGMSVFPSKVSYACQDKVIALSLETSVKGKTVSLISADKNVIKDCRQRESQRNESIARERNNNPNKELKKAFMIELTKVRKDVIKSERTLRKKECRKHYCNLVELAETRLNQKPVDLFNTFSVEDIKGIVKDLELNSNSSKEKYISYEINALKSVINLKTMIGELEQLLQQEDFSSDAYVKKLDEVSAYLCSHDAGRNLMLKVAELIEQQKENCDDLTAEYIACTVQEIRKTAEQKPEKSFGQSGSAYGQASAKPDSNIMQLADNNTWKSVHLNQDGAASVSDRYSDRLREALSNLVKSVQEIWHIVTDKVSQAVQQAFSKPYSDVSEKPEQKSAPELDMQENLSESEPAEPAPETEIADDDEYIIRDVYSLFAGDSIGTQGYESYVMIVPADKLDFQIPFTYETEPHTEIQQTEQEITENKAVPTSFKTKQTEYDDY